MDAEEALKFVDELLSQQGKQLSDLQRFVFLGTWDGKDYKEIHQDCEAWCTLDHLKRNVGYQLWKLLSAVLDEKVLKGTLQHCVYRAHRRWQEQQIVQPQLQDLEPLLPHPIAEVPLLTNNLTAPASSPYIDWGDAPLANPFYGYTSLLERLNDAVRVNVCRLISLYGISGVGKTTIALHLARQVRDQFEFVIWRSLKQAPSLDNLLSDMTRHLPHPQENTSDMNRFMQWIVNHRCLIVLDGLESVLCSGVHDGSYQPGYESYSDLLRQVGTTPHESCLIITGWDNPKEISEIEEQGYVCSEAIKGFGTNGTRDLLTRRRCSGAEHQWQAMTRRYWGHPLVLNAIATYIREMCRGDTAWFLKEFSDTLTLDEIYPHLARQLERLSKAEQITVQHLKEQGAPVSFTELQHGLKPHISVTELIKVLRSLNRRAIVEVNATSYSLPSLIMEYLQVSR